MNRKLPSLAALAMILSGSALAQSTSRPSATPAPPVPERPPSATTTTPPAEQIAPGGEHGTLSDRLARDNGTVKPPTVDPGMAKPPPSTAGSMPVIPPPGSPGGNPKVQPK